MKHLTLKEKFIIIKSTCKGSSIGIHNFGLLHEIADALGMKNNTGYHLRSINQRITRIMRELISAEYPITEYKIKCCSWSSRESWHAYFKIDDASDTWEEMMLIGINNKSNEV